MAKSMTRNSSGGSRASCDTKREATDGARIRIKGDPLHRKRTATVRLQLETKPSADLFSQLNLSRLRNRRSDSRPNENASSSMSTPGGKASC